ncbi:hypothetical protein JTE90_024312 [Oedothorax gibbosus]|uniref:Uncharacterized protein n=1 Tax=Oedothorax gibbosus TaxID=931172 RepID=A0AAV6VXV9_9ARAC|nr:hypothetical protein JTE90_024312 [Oedothorax gibbosus]
MDGGSNVQAMVDILVGPKKFVYCFAHLLNLIITDGLTDANNKRLAEVLTAVKAIVTFARQSHVFMEKLREKQESAGVVESNVMLLVQSVPTRWNSTYAMLCRFVAMSPLVAAVVANPLIKKLTCNDKR